MSSTTVKHGFDLHGKFVKPTTNLLNLSPLDHKNLWPHQLRFFQELRDEPYWFVVGPPAAGKSLTVSALLTAKLQQDLNLRAVIAVPQTIIGEGFEDNRFYLPPDNVKTFFDPGARLHHATEGSKIKQFKNFLTKEIASPVNDRVLICTHQSLVFAYKRFPELFQNVLVVIDEAHHSKAPEEGVERTEEEIKEDSFSNCLGAAVVGLIDRGEQVGLATATVSRADGCGLLGPHKDKFKVAECPFDDYLKVCKWFQSFSFDFVLYDQELSVPVDQLLGNKRKKPPKTIIHIPNVNSQYSSSKPVDLAQVYRGIAGCSSPQSSPVVKNPKGDKDGITLIKRGSRWIKVVDLVNEENRTLKKKVITDAHKSPSKDSVDIVVALNMFKEGANWRWAEKSIIIGYRSSFTELAQIVGRGLRDAPEKVHTSIHYVLRQQKQNQDTSEEENDSTTIETLNDYLKALLFVLLLEDVFKPVKIRVRNKSSGNKSRLVRTDLLSEAVDHDFSEKLRIEGLIIEELLSQQYDENFGERAAVNAVVDILEQEEVRHEEVTLKDIARQIVKSHLRRQSTVEKLEKDVKLLNVPDIDVELIQKAKHPLSYLLYYTDGIGISTLGALRTSLQSNKEKEWWKMYHLLEDFVKLYERIPKYGDIFRNKSIGVWVSAQRNNFKTKRLLLERKIALERTQGWRWSVHNWSHNYKILKEFVEKYSRVPYRSENYMGVGIGVWVLSQRINYSRESLAEERIRLLNLVPKWSWTGDYLQLVWDRRIKELKFFIKENKTFPTRTTFIGKWLQTQRHRRKTNRLPPERVLELNQISSPMCSSNMEKWFKALSDLQKFLLPSKGKFPAKYSNESKEKYLGAWVSKQRIYYRNKRLPPERIKLLEETPGWYWSKEDKPKTAPPKDRYASVKKQKARSDTIVDFYRKVFRRKKLPASKQYWSMCAQCADEDGTLVPHTELHQLLEMGLVKPVQFHGVDRNKAVFDINRNYRGSYWYCGDFYDALSLVADEVPDFNPGIVNVDTVYEPRTGVELFCKVLDRLSHVQNVLFVGNFILHNRGNRHTVEEVVQQINSNSKFRHVAPTLHWNEERVFYTYQGSTSSHRTLMCTVMMWRK